MNLCVGLWQMATHPFAGRNCNRGSGWCAVERLDAGTIIGAQIITILGIVRIHYCVLILTVIKTEQVIDFVEGDII